MNKTAINVTIVNHVLDYELETVFPSKIPTENTLISLSASVSMTLNRECD